MQLEHHPIQGPHHQQLLQQALPQEQQQQQQQILLLQSPPPNQMEQLQQLHLDRIPPCLQNPSASWLKVHPCAGMGPGMVNAAAFDS